jgi:hypothetical protein
LVVILYPTGVMNGPDVIENLDDAVIEHGIRRHIRSDSNPQCLAKDLHDWLAQIGAKTLSAEPRSLRGKWLRRIVEKRWSIFQVRTVFVPRLSECLSLRANNRSPRNRAKKVVGQVFPRMNLVYLSPPGSWTALDSEFCASCIIFLAAQQSKWRFPSFPGAAAPARVLRAWNFPKSVPHSFLAAVERS